MPDFRDFLRLNVGFIVHQTVGYSRDFPLEIPSIRISSDLDLVDLQGVARVTRTTQSLLVQVRMSAFIWIECVRCLNQFPQLLEIGFTDLYAFSPDSITESGLILPESEKIDLEPVVREEMLLAIPINPICSTNCKGLCPICGNDLNQSVCVHDDVNLNPPLDENGSPFGEE